MMIRWKAAPLARRLFTQTTTRSFKIPPPTWSLKDLNLKASAVEPVSEEELQTLAKRALIDVSRITDTQGLRQDLANMMHYLEQVQSVKLPDMTEEQIYDAPRNLTAAPVRKSTATEEQTEEAARVLEQLLRQNATKHGAHEYFSVVTKKEDVS